MVETIEATLMGIYFRGHVVRYGPRLGPYRVIAKVATQSFDVKHPVRYVATTNRKYR